MLCSALLLLVFLTDSSTADLPRVLIALYECNPVNQIYSRQFVHIASFNLSCVVLSDLQVDQINPKEEQIRFPSPHAHFLSEARKHG